MNPHQAFDRITQDKYAMPSSQEAALILIDTVRSQAGRIKRQRDTLASQDEKLKQSKVCIRELEAALRDLLGAVKHLEPCPATYERAIKALPQKNYIQ